VKFEGSHTLPLTPAEVAQRLVDPRALCACVPGLVSLEPRADALSRYDAVLEVRLPALTGRFEGSLEVLDQHPPERLTLRLAGKGALGFVNGQVALTLSPLESAAAAPASSSADAAAPVQTRVNYDADVQIGGTVARLGQRMLSGITREMAGQFFGALARWNPQRPDEKVAPSPVQSALDLAARTALRGLGLRRDED
jgi:carbon monoxide dehydrogenase subunit G